MTREWSCFIRRMSNRLSNGSLDLRNGTAVLTLNNLWILSRESSSFGKPPYNRARYIYPSYIAEPPTAMAVYFFFCLFFNSQTRFSFASLPVLVWVCVCVLFHCEVHTVWLHWNSVWITAAEILLRSKGVLANWFAILCGCVVWLFSASASNFQPATSFASSIRRRSHHLLIRRVRVAVCVFFANCVRALRLATAHHQLSKISWGEESEDWAQDSRQIV